MPYSFVGTAANSVVIVDDEGNPVTAISSSNVDPRIVHAINVIYATYGVTVGLKPKNLLKFGYNADVDTGARETVWSLGGEETYVETNIIDSISSSSGSDTGLVYYEDHTISSGNKTFVTNTVTLQGQTRVALPTPVARLNRLKNRGAANWVGTVYGYENTAITNGVPNDLTKAHIAGLPGADNTSFKAATAFSSVDYGLITQIYAGINKTSNGRGDIYLQVKQPGGVWDTQWQLPVSTTSNSFADVEFSQGIIVPANYDVKMTAEVTANDTIISSSFTAYILTVI